MKHLLLIICCCLPMLAQAHRLAPSLLAIEEIGDSRFSVYWKTSRYTEPAARLQPVLPSDCRDLSAPEPQSTESGIAWLWQVSCKTDLVGGSLVVEGLERSASAVVLVEMQWRDGRQLRKTLTPEAAQWKVPARATFTAVIGEYLWLGIEHIWLGWDHLAFVIALMLLASGWHARIAAISGFTLGHSITLVATALNWLVLPSRWVELGIAASIVWVAYQALQLHSQAEATRSRTKVSSMAAISTAFGLLHGAGFASVLLDIGLPKEALITALAAFNIGIELGQLVFVAVLMLLTTVYERSSAALPSAQRPAPALLGWMVGALGVFWVIERVVGA